MKVCSVGTPIQTIYTESTNRNLLEWLLKLVQIQEYILYTPQPYKITLGK